jgi:hypothetical protein
VRNIYAQIKSQKPKEKSEKGKKKNIKKPEEKRNKD